MPLLDGAHRALDRVARVTPARRLLQRRYDRFFAANERRNLFRGVFATFDEALKSAPATRPLGYDNAESAALYVERTRRLYATDYPVMFWLGRLFAEGRRSIFDVGGHIGVSYYAYQRHLPYPDGLTWQVHDVPAVNEQGRRFAAERDAARRLTFSDRFEDANGVDILTAQGSLQYLPETLAEHLSRLSDPPKHLLVNLTPVHDELAFWTLQSIGTAFCPYRISAAGEFVSSLEALGYRLVDAWENPEKKCHIPFQPEHSLDVYRGFHFALQR